MKAKKCDRCEKFYDPYSPGTLTKYSNMLIFADDRGNAYVETRQFDLCESCMMKAVAFMQEELPNIE